MDKRPALSDLEYFLTIVSEGSLTRASKVLRVQQSTLTTAVQRLERMTERALLVRAKTGVQLTQSGKVFLRRSKILLEQWEGITRAVSGKSEKVRTRFSLGCHQSTGVFALRNFLPRFLHAHPEMEITVQHDYTSAIVENVLRYRLDFGLAVNPVPHRELAIIPLYETYLGLWGSKSSARWNNGTLLYDPRMYGLELVLSQLEKSKARYERYLVISNLDTIAMLVASGAGQGMLPADTVGIQTESSLKLIWKPSRMPEFKVYLIYRKDAHDSAASRLFIDTARREWTKLRPGPRRR